MFKLNDEQRSQVMRAAAPLGRGTRLAFMRDLATELTKVDLIGDGALFRVLREVQKRHFDAPDLSRAHGKTAKYR